MYYNFIIIVLNILMNPECTFLIDNFIKTRVHYYLILNKMYSYNELQFRLIIKIKFR